MSEDTIKDALRMLPYGFYALTSRGQDDVNIMVVNWLMQTSFTPRQVAVGLAKSAYTHKLVDEGGVFAVNIFNQADEETIKQFTKSREKDPDKVKNATYTAGPETGCPIITGAAAFLECKVVGKLDSGGDHDIIVGEVINAGVYKPGEASETLTLTQIGWSYAG